MKTSRKKTGYIYITDEGNVGFDFGDFHYEIFGSRVLTEIKSVLVFNPKETFIDIDTNYGEEFYYLSENLEDAHSEDIIDIYKVLNEFDSLEIRNRGVRKMGKTLQNLKDDAFRIMHNIACYKIIMNGTKVLQVRDLNNLKYHAEFFWDTSIDKFTLLQSTFANGKRKYEMLYLIERNDDIIWEELNNA